MVSTGTAADEVIIDVFQFDGQTVWADRGTPLLEVGNFLGGGAAGTVYECEHAQTHEHFALKILNPLGFKLVAPALLRKFMIVFKGAVVPSSDREKELVCKEHVWWLLDGSTKQHVAAYYSERQNCLKDLSLNQCIQVWGAHPVCVGDDDRDGDDVIPMEQLLDASTGVSVTVPCVPPKYADFVRRRARIFREILNMRKTSDHVNVIRLQSVLELAQESKCTIFLVMELANGGELFDRIKIDCGTRESTAKYFFQQLLEGVQHCHAQGVCHRDLKPENLLLQDGGEETVLKIADFGFSARFMMGGASTEDETKERPRPQYEAQVMHSGVTPVAPSSLLEEFSPLRVLKSVVGSPFYVAPEVLQARGYDGPKADIWSLGVILYAMLAGNLPFGQELGTCKRFRHFCKWVREQQQKNERFWEAPDLEYPPWLFPARFSVLAKGLIVSMLHPDPERRVTIAESMQHPLCYREPTKTEAAQEAATTATTSDSAESGVDAVVELASQMSIAASDTHTEEAEAEDDDDEDGFFQMEEEGEDDLGDSNNGAQQRQQQQQQQQVLPPRPPAAAPMPMAGAVAANGTVFNSVSSPPPAPALERSNSGPIDDLVLGDEELGVSAQGTVVARAAEKPPAFSGLVKRSTRFLTSVAASDVLTKVERLLEECRLNKVQTPVGFIGKLVVNWDNYRLEVWGEDASGPPLSALQLYQMPHDVVQSLSIAASPMPASFMAGSFGAVDSATGQPVARPIFMVEFVRGELESFIFQRFYQWVREKLSELVKRDWEGAKYLDYMSPSPRLDSAILQAATRGYKL